ncbi:MAG: hypothetical protein ACREJO_19065 [Phycisphaerales bacterium]
MTLDHFLEHHGLIENPFAGEEARHDAVFARMSDAVSGVRAARHAEFQKIVGDVAHPGTAVVFGEKGAGKTALRLQVEAAAERHNQTTPGRRVLVVACDDLDPFLERLHARFRTVKGGKESPVLDSLKRIRVQDHIDIIMHLVVPRLVDALLGHAPRAAGPVPVGAEPRLALKTLDRSLKRDLLVLQVCYDRADQASERSAELRRAMNLRRPIGLMVEGTVAFFGWLLPAGVLALWWYYTAREVTPVWSTAFFAAMGVWLAFLLKRAVGDRFGLRHRAHRLQRQVRITGRPEPSFLASLRQLYPWWRTSSILPTTDNESVRMEMVQRLLRVLRQFGHAGLIVVIDRVDEPALVAGDPERMKAIVWPVLNSRLLHTDGLGIKLLLPIELRHMLMRESAAFFTAARLDKQNLVEDLSWSGATLYDLCNLRLAACRREGAESPTTLADLFAEDVVREELLGALNEMRQPRDAFRFIYRCIATHCQRTTDDSGQWRISKGVLEEVRKQQVERMKELQMGVRPG